MKNLNKWIENHLYSIILLFLFIQPVLDILTAFSIHYFHFQINISSIIRFFFLFFCIYYIFFLNTNKDKKKNIIYIVLYFIYLLFYFVSILIYKGNDAIIYEIQNNFNIFYFPIVFIGLNGMFRQYHFTISLKQIWHLFLLYLAFVFIPNFFHIGFASYEHSKVGNIGWFLSANTIGSILSIFLPLILLYFCQTKDKKIEKMIFILCILFVFFSIGTKVPVLSIAILIIVNIFYFIICWIKSKKYKNLAFLSGILVIGITGILLLLPRTSFYKNIMIHKKFLKIDHYSEVLTDPKLLDHFVFSQRLTFLKKTHENYKKSSMYEKLVGIGFIENYGTDQVSMKTIEIDYFEIFYRSGIIGFLIYFIVFIPVIYQCFCKIKQFSFSNIQYFTILLFILLLTFFQGHILVTPSVSIYVALISNLILNNALVSEKS